MWLLIHVSITYPKPVFPQPVNRPRCAYYKLATHSCAALATCMRLRIRFVLRTHSPEPLRHSLQRTRHRCVSRSVQMARPWKRAANKKLIATAANFQPEMILLGHCDIIQNQTLEAIRAAVPGVRIAYRNLDPLFVPRNVEAIQHRAESCDSIFVTTAGDDLNIFAAKEPASTTCRTRAATPSTAITTAKNRSPNRLVLLWQQRRTLDRHGNR